jgi:hypothetical protein
MKLLSVAAAFVPTRTDTRAAAGHDRYCSRHGGPIGIGIVHLIRTGRDLLPNLPSFISRVRSVFGPCWGGLQIRSA